MSKLLLLFFSDTIKVYYNNIAISVIDLLVDIFIAKSTTLPKLYYQIFNTAIRICIHPYTSV